MGACNLKNNVYPTLHDQTKKIRIDKTGYGYFSYAHYDYFPISDLNSNGYLVKKHNCSLIKM